MKQRCDEVTELVSEIAGRYRLASLVPLLDSCRAAVEQVELNVAVIGRFKAGKSSFLNHLLGRDLLPVGVTPVTAVITEIGYGTRERALIHYLDGHIEEAALEAIPRFIIERENPENIKRVARVSLELPGLERLGGFRFVDTPGLESTLEHNTEAALHWLPNVGLALVAISIDTPLSQHDLALLKSLRQYTPNISILLTKADLLSTTEQAEVLSFVRGQLTRAELAAVPLLLYSVRAGAERFKAQVEERLFKPAMADFQAQRSTIITRKLETLLDECADYLRLALMAAETVEVEREALKQQVIGEREAVQEVKSQLRLVIRHATGGTRDLLAKRLDAHQADVQARLLEELHSEFPRWTQSLSHSLKSYEDWLERKLASEMAALSHVERAQFLAPLGQVQRQVLRLLQTFRTQLSARTERAFGVPLRTAEPELRLAEPRQPDIRIGRIFDHAWDLFSPLAPMWLVRPLLRRHFTGKLPYLIEKNLSRLASQWAEAINDALAQLGREAERRMDELIETVARLLSGSRDSAPQLRDELARIQIARAEISRMATREAAG